MGEKQRIIHTWLLCPENKTGILFVDSNFRYIESLYLISSIVMFFHVLLTLFLEFQNLHRDYRSIVVSPRIAGQNQWI